MEYVGKKYLENEGAEDDKEYVPKDVEASGEVHLADVAGVGYGEAEEIDEVEANVESERLLVLAVGMLVDTVDEGEERGCNGEGCENEDEHGGGNGVGEES